MTVWRVTQVLIVTVVVGVLGFRFLGEGEGEGEGPPPLGAPPAETRIDVDTPELRAAKASLGVAACPDASGAVSELPAVTLSCLGGGPDVALDALDGPAVVNLWASWCAPCKEELPHLARLHEEAGDRLTVVGVDYQDPDPAGALDLLGRTGVTYPQLADPGGSLADHLRIRGMPGTLYVDDAGAVTFVNLPFDSYEELTGLVRDHTGVVVSAR